MSRARTTTADLRRYRIHIATLHAVFNVAHRPYPAHRAAIKRDQQRRHQALVDVVVMLGGIREKDLRAITGHTQSTLYRQLDRLAAAQQIRIVTTYRDGHAGARPRWILPHDRAGLTAEQRAEFIELADLIKRYHGEWDARQAAASEPLPVSAAAAPRQRRTDRTVSAAVEDQAQPVLMLPPMAPEAAVLPAHQPASLPAAMHTAAMLALTLDAVPTAIASTAAPLVPDEMLTPVCPTPTPTISHDAHDDAGNAGAPALPPDASDARKPWYTHIFKRSARQE